MDKPNPARAARGRNAARVAAENAAIQRNARVALGLDAPANAAAGQVAVAAAGAGAGTGGGGAAVGADENEEYGEAIAGGAGGANGNEDVGEDEPFHEPLENFSEVLDEIGYSPGARNILISQGMSSFDWLAKSSVKDLEFDICAKLCVRSSY